MANQKNKPKPRPQSGSNPAGRPSNAGGSSPQPSGSANRPASPPQKTAAPNRPLTSGAPAGGERKLTPRQEAAQRRVRQRRRNQLIVIAGLVAVTAVALIVLAIVVSTPTTFQGIPASATTDDRPFEKGAADAKVTVEEYVDYQCPACKLWHDNNQPNFLKDYIDSGKSVKYIMKLYPFLDTNSAERESHNATEAAFCAADQKRFWDFHDAIFDNQPRTENSGYWSYNRLKELAKALKLNTDSFNKCLDSNTYKNKANAEAAAAVQRGVGGTPSFFVNGKALSGASYDDLKKMIDEALAAAK